MNRDSEIYYETYFDLVKTNDLRNQFNSSLKSYLHKLNEYPILEIGGGVGVDTISIASTGKRICCVEKEIFIIRLLNKRVIESNEINSTNLQIEFIQQEFPYINLSESYYSCIILSNLLHFFDNATIIKSIDISKKLASVGGLIHIKTHSINHPFNIKKQHSDVFKNYFDKNRLKSLFPPIDFDIIHLSEDVYVPTDIDMKIKLEWIKRYRDEIDPKSSFEDLLKQNPIDDPEVSINLIAIKK